MSTRSLTLTLAGAAAVLLAVAACEKNATAPTQQVISRVQANDMAQELTTDVDLLSSSVTFETGTTPFVANLSGSATMPSLTGGPCPTVSPLPPANSDADRVPDSLRFDFTGCSFTGERFTFTLSGTIDLLDPTPTDSDRAIEFKFGDFTRSVTNTLSGATFSTKQNGIRTVIANPNQLSHTETNFRTDFTYPNGSTASHVRDWTSVFTADVAGSIHPDQPLPSGTWHIAGTSTWTRGDRSYELIVSTDPDLHHNASCTVRPKFDNGTLKAQITRVNGDQTQQATVTIQFTACGQYTVTRS